MRILPAAGSGHTYNPQGVQPWHRLLLVGWGRAAGLPLHPDADLAAGGQLPEPAFLDDAVVLDHRFIVSTTCSANILGIQVANRFNIILMLIQLTIIAVFIALCCTRVGHQRPGRSASRSSRSSMPTCRSRPPWPGPRSPATDGVTLGATSVLSFAQFSTSITVSVLLTLYLVSS